MATEKSRKRRQREDAALFFGLLFVLSLPVLLMLRCDEAAADPGLEDHVRELVRQELEDSGCCDQSDQSPPDDEEPGPEPPGNPVPPGGGDCAELAARGAPQQTPWRALGGAWSGWCAARGRTDFREGGPGGSRGVPFGHHASLWVGGGWKLDDKGKLVKTPGGWDSLELDAEVMLPESWLVSIGGRHIGGTNNCPGVTPAGGDCLRLDLNAPRPTGWRMTGYYRADGAGGDRRCDWLAPTRVFFPGTFTRMLWRVSFDRQDGVLAGSMLYENPSIPGGRVVVERRCEYPPNDVSIVEFIKWAGPADAAVPESRTDVMWLKNDSYKRGSL